MKSISNTRKSRKNLGSLFMACAMFVQSPLPGGTLAVALTGGALSLLATLSAEARLGSVRGRGVGRPGVGAGGAGRPGVGVGGAGRPGVGVGGAARGTVRRTTRRVVRRTARRVTVLGAGASLVYLGGMPYYYWGGCYYEQQGNVYVEVIVE